MLRLRIIGIICFCIITLITALFVISKTTLIASYEEIESNQMIRNLERVDHAIRNYRNSLNIKLRDWAQWDDSYRFIQGQDEEYISINLGNPTLINLEIDYMAFENASGTMVFAKRINRATETEIPSEDITNAILKNNLSKKVEDTVSDVIAVGDELFFVEGLPIIQSNGEGPSRGTMYFAKKIDSFFIAYLGELTRLPVSLMPPSHSKTFTVERSNGNDIRGYFPLYDASSTARATISVSYARTIYQQGQTSIAAYGFISSAAILLFGLITLLLFEVLLLRRLSSLSRDVDTISASNLAKMRLQENSDDELGKFTQTINHLLDELAIAQKKEQASAQAEMLANEKIKKSLKSSEDMNKLMVGRELKMVELKEKVVALEEELSRYR